jgi:hypothetical protein
MAWYNTPIRPFDPLNPEDAPLQPERYIRDSFTATGQDSHTEPPAQDQSQWQAITNVMPVTAGILNRRWGFNPFGTPPAFINWMTNFQRDKDNLRTIVVSSPQQVAAFTETGAVYNAGIFGPTCPPAAKVRSLTSRSYQYFYDGTAADLTKWNGAATGGTSNWGISMVNNTGALTAGPNGPSNIPSSSGFTNPTNIEANDGVFTTATISYPNNASISADTFGFSGIPSNAVITGIEVDIKGKASSPTSNSATVTLVKAGTVYGSDITASFSGTNAFVTYGGMTNLWGGSWLPSDFNSVTNFGVLIIVNPSTLGSVTYSLDYVRIKIFYNGGLSAITETPGGAGNITLTVGRIYYCVFQNSITGQFSDLNAASGSTGPLTSQVVALSTIPVSSDTQVDSKIILATADGGDPSILYFLASIPNATTTYTDNTPDGTLIFQQEYLFTDQFGNEFGVTNNTPPTSINGNLAIKHQGRLWMANGQNIFFSKSVAELTLPNGFIAGKYEECWPLSNYFDISEGAETVSGLLTDGTTLYIGTQSHIRRLLGNDPTNFQAPQIVHPQVGLINQDVWQIVFQQGTPAGCMWLTPDFRVIGSDFNTYTDVGKPVQDVLNSINSQGATLAHAMFVSDGEFDLYILSVPIAQTTYCDTTLVYDMRGQHWYIWQPAGGAVASFFNINAAGVPQWLFISGNNMNIYQYQQTATSDNGTVIPVSARTSWMHFGAPAAKKVLDELEVTGDTSILVSIFGASNENLFDTPNTIVSNAPLVVSPFGEFKVYLAAQTSTDRYYQILFQSSNNLMEFLNGYNLRFTPWNTI